MTDTVSQSQMFQRLLLKVRLRQVQMIVAVAQSGSMQQAARDLAVSQPAITKAVGEIETDLGILLFDRHARGIRLTRIGKSVLPLMERILDATDTFSQAVAMQRTSGSTLLRVGSVAAGISGLLASRVPAFLGCHPDIVLRINEIDGRQILSLAARDEVDVLVCRVPDSRPEGWSFVPVVDDEHAILAARHHPLAGRKDVTLADLQACTWLMPPAGVPAEAEMEALFAGRPTPDLVRLPTRSRTLNRAAIQELGALSVAPISIYRAELDAGTLARIDFPLSTALRPIGLLRPDSSVGQAMDRFVAFMAPGAGRGR